MTVILKVKFGLMVGRISYLERSLLSQFILALFTSVVAFQLLEPQVAHRDVVGQPCFVLLAEVQSEYSCF